MGNPLTVSYNISRPVTTPRFRHVLISLTIAFIIIITLVNVVSVGYDTINYSSTEYNVTHRLWYDSFVPHRPSSYNHRSCEPALIKLNDYFATNSNYTFFLYQLVDFVDPTHNGATSSIDALNYSNNPFSDCTVHSLSLSAYLNPVALELESPAIVACNTSSDKYMFFQTSSDVATIGYILGLQSGVQGYFDSYGPGPLSIQNASLLMFAMARIVFKNFATYTTVLDQFSAPAPLLRYSLTGSIPLSYLHIVYTDNDEGTTPADGSWTVSVAWQALNASDTNSVKITFLPTLGVDVSKSPNFHAANTTLAPTIATINSAATQAHIADFDFWELMNWMFVVHYWGLLMDFGQVAPTTWNWTGGELQDYGPIRYSSAYNPFVNETLFRIYYDYFNRTVLSLWGLSSFPELAPLNETNHLSQSTVSLRTLYSCSDLTLKSSQSLVISLIVADWALHDIFLAVLLAIGVYIETRTQRFSNNCEGCDKLEERVQVLEQKLLNRGEFSGDKNGVAIMTELEK